MNRDNTYLKNNQFARGHKPNKTSYKKGRKSWNKGKKYNEKEKEKLDLSGLEKGRQGYEVGTKTIRRTKADVKRRFIKKKNGKWGEYAKYLWEQKYGGLKDNDVVHHINGEFLDDRVKNLIALPRKDHPIFHNRWGLKKLTKEQIKFYKNRYKEQRLSPLKS